jgi:hypothetical protein
MLVCNSHEVKLPVTRSTEGWVFRMIDRQGRKQPEITIVAQ